MFTADIVAYLPQLLQGVRREVYLLAILKTDRIDNKMVVHALNTVVVVCIQMRCHQHLITRKRLLGKLQTDAVSFIIRLDLTRHEGLHILIKIGPRCFAVKIFRCHELVISVCP